MNKGLHLFGDNDFDGFDVSDSFGTSAEDSSDTKNAYFGIKHQGSIKQARHFITL